MYALYNVAKFVTVVLLVVVISTHAYADIVSLDSNFVEGQADIVTKLNNDRIALTNGINNIQGGDSGSVQASGQIKADTIDESNMGDDANPRIRDFELGGLGTECEPVYIGMLTVTTSGTLTGSVPTGTAYPRGFRIRKDSSTARIFTADRWTYVDIDTTGTFQYSETAIDASTPSIALNSIRISRVSTDSTQITNVLDLRVRSCAQGPFSALKDASGEGALSNLLENGRPIRSRGQQGWLQGAQVSFDTHTTFLVRGGSAFINGKYRAVNPDITISTTDTDNPAKSTSGIDTGAIAASTRYFVYLAADEDSVVSYSVTYSTTDLPTGPSGVTNFRKVGEILTDATSLFTSRDITLTNAIHQREMISAWVNFGEFEPIFDSYNISSITVNGGTDGDYTITFDKDFGNAFYAWVAGTRTGSASGTAFLACFAATANVPTAGSLTLNCQGDADTARIASNVQVIVTGERQT